MQWEEFIIRNCRCFTCTTDLTGTQKLLMTLLLVARYDIYELSCLARMRPEDVAVDLAELKRKGYLQGR